jgi:phenylacetic acid degradation operon negative regulatory protein
MSGRIQLEDVLAMAVLGFDLAARPTLHNLATAFNRFEGIREGSTALRLEEKGWIASKSGQEGQYLTAAGLKAVFGNRDPQEAWGRVWDGKWRMVLFDLPQKAGSVRVKIWRWLHQHHFGCLKGSVWIRPDGVEGLEALEQSLHQAALFSILEGAPVGGAKNPVLVGTAWNFERINLGYAAYLDEVARLKKNVARERGMALAELCRKEGVLWRAAVERDPLLPAALLPPGYRGREAHAARLDFFRTSRPAA